jgi:hypothetical protein
MVSFGLDISHHQDLNLSLSQCKQEGISFVVIKSSEGANFIDPEFTRNLAEARDAGLLVAAYHYVRANVPASNQLTNIRKVVPLDVPLIPDVEEGSGGVADVRSFIWLARSIGYTVPFLYLPRWYWQELGRPSLAGLPPLWSSRYPDNAVGSVTDEFADVPANYWVGYGGLPVGLLQFTSSARIAGYQPLDANAFRGTREELAVLFGGQRRMPRLVLAHATNDTQHWLGDMIVRRKVASDELAGVKFWLQQLGESNVVQIVNDLRVIGEELPPVATVELDYDRLLNDLTARVVERLHELVFRAE